MTLVAMALLAGACSTEDAPRRENHAPAEEGGVPMMLSVVPSTDPDATGDKQDAGTDAERAINPDHLYIATYSADGKLIDALLTDGKTSDDAVYYPDMSYGPTVIFRVANEKFASSYQGKDFYVVAYSIPENTRPDSPQFAWNDINATNNYNLKWPGAAGSVWAPADNNTDNIPMAGCVKVTPEAYAQAEAAVTTGHIKLPSVPLPRAMAKVVINDVDNILAEVSLTTLDKGLLIPDFDYWWNAGAIAPRAAASTNPLAQKLTDPNGTTSHGKGQYTFYAYEMDFTDKASNAPERQLITVKAKDAFGIAHDRLTKQISIAPYSEGELADYTAEELKTYDEGFWCGLLRNHIYEYNIHKPANGELVIYVKAGEWTIERETFDY